MFFNLDKMKATITKGICDFYLLVCPRTNLNKL